MSPGAATGTSDSTCRRARSSSLEDTASAPCAPTPGAIPLDDGCADVVVAGEVLEHVADLEGVVAEVCRVLRPGGLLVIDTIADTWWARFSSITVAERLPAGPPRRLHDGRLFVDRAELLRRCARHGVDLELRGLRPSGRDYLGWLLRRRDDVRMLPTRSTAGLFQAQGTKTTRPGRRDGPPEVADRGTPAHRRPRRSHRTVTTRTILPSALRGPTDALARARELAPRLASRAEAHDRAGTFAADDLAELRAAGLLGLMSPQRLGGAGAGFADYAEVAMALAAGSGATALVFNMHASVTGALASTPDELARAMGVPETFFAMRDRVLTLRRRAPSTPSR